MTAINIDEHELPWENEINELKHRKSLARQLGGEEGIEC